MTRPRLLALAALIAAAAFARLAPHPPNVTPLGALALFAGASVADRRLALLAPLAAVFLSDLALGLHVLIPIVYASFAVSVLLGRWLRARPGVGNTAAATLAGSLQFFAVTNFADWLVFYPPTLAGLAECYTSAVPYFRNTLAGDAAFAVALFGGLSLVEKLAPAAREPAAA